MDYHPRETSQVTMPGAQRWAEAIAIYRSKGDGAARWVASRIGALARDGDLAGVERFKAIARKARQADPSVGLNPRRLVSIGMAACPT
jgi:hypothetical protein